MLETLRTCEVSVLEEAGRVALELGFVAAGEVLPESRRIEDLAENAIVVRGVGSGAACGRELSGGCGNGTSASPLLQAQTLGASPCLSPGSPQHIDAICGARKEGRGRGVAAARWRRLFGRAGRVESR